MDWFRAHHGISNDIKFGLIAAKLDVPRCEVGWVWVILLDHASQNTEDRGSIGSLQNDEISMMAGIPVSRVEIIVQALKDRKMLSRNGRLTAWDKRQPDADPTNAERQRRYRDRRRRDVTLPEDSNALRNTEQNRTEQIEQNRTEQTQSAPAAAGVRAPVQPIREPRSDIQPSGRFEEVWERWPRQNHRTQAESDWFQHVTVGNEEAALACVENYLASEEVSRGVVRNLGTIATGGGIKSGWLADCARDGWSSKWPRARDAPGSRPKLTALDRLIQEAKQDARPPGV
jgi:hypothetical protein